MSLPEWGSSGPFRDLAWAALYCHAVFRDDHNAFASVYSDESLRDRLLQMPGDVPLEEIRTKLIDGFLNKWRSRMQGNRDAAIRDGLVRAQDALGWLAGESIETVEFDRALSSSADGLRTVEDAVTTAFDALCKGWGIGPTSAAKVLGVVMPELFVMWDEPIAKHYLS